MHAYIIFIWVLQHCEVGVICNICVFASENCPAFQWRKQNPKAGSLDLKPIIVPLLSPPPPPPRTGTVQTLVDTDAPLWAPCMPVCGNRFVPTHFHRDLSLLWWGLPSLGFSPLEELCGYFVYSSPSLWNSVAETKKGAGQCLPYQFLVTAHPILQSISLKSFYCCNTWETWVAQSLFYVILLTPFSFIKCGSCHPLPHTLLNLEMLTSVRIEDKVCRRDKLMLISSYFKKVESTSMDTCYPQAKVWH
jgi:hypothetical protein